MENQLTFDGNQGIAQSAGDIINIIGDGINITTTARGNTVLINSGANPVVNSINAQTISFPTTLSSQGIVYVNGKTFLHSFSTGSPSVYLGSESGNTGYASEGNVAIGSRVLCNSNGASFNTSLNGLQSLVTGKINVVGGYLSFGRIVHGDGNVGLGSYVGGSLEASYYNTFLGSGSGSYYQGAESYNIILGCSSGVVGDEGVIRIGNDGSISEAKKSTKVFIQGIAGNVTGSELPVFVNTKTGQLVTQSSSKESKTNIKDVSSMSDLLHKLKPVSFNFKDVVDGVTHYGLLAEDVLQVIPDLVNINSENKPSGIKYTEIIALLINEVQKLKKDIDDLKPMNKRITKLENKEA